jgi:hypothetical protein
VPNAIDDISVLDARRVEGDGSLNGADVRMIEMNAGVDDRDADATAGTAGETG